MDNIHHLLAYLVAVAVAVGLAWSAAPLLTRRFAGLATERLHAAVVATTVLASVSGITMLAAGSSPRDGMHFFYAAVAVLVLPLARSFGGQAPGRRRDLLLFAGFATLAAVVYRLFATG